MQRLLRAVAVLLLLTGPALADSTVHGLSTSSTSPLPAGSCLYVDQGPGTDTKLCSGYAAAIGAAATANNLSDLASPSTALSNLGGAALLGTNQWGNGSAGQNNQSICALTPGASITPSAAGCAEWTLTPNQNSTINLPTSLPASASASFDGKLIITQPASGGPWCITLAAGTGFYTSAAGAQPVCSTANSAIDVLPMTVLGGGSPEVLITNNGVSNFQPVTNVALRSNHTFSQNAGSVTSLTASLSGNAAGDLMTVETTGCTNGGCTPAVGTPPTISDTLGDTCVAASGAFYNGNGGGGDATAIFLCKNIAAGSPTITVSWGGATVYYPFLAVQTWKVPAWMTQADAGIGNTSNSSSASGVSVSTAAATTLNGELVISVCNGGGAPSGVIGTTIDHNTNSLVQYLLPPVTAQATITSTQTSGNPFGCSIAAFQ